MSLVRTVARLIEERGGHGNADDLAKLLRGYTRKQIIHALSNAKDTGLLEVVRRGKSMGRPSGSEPAEYRRTAKSLKPLNPGKPPRRKDAKVQVDPQPWPAKAKPEPEPEPQDDEENEKPLTHGNLPPRGKIPKVASVWELASVL